MNKKYNNEDKLKHCKVNNNSKEFSNIEYNLQLSAGSSGISIINLW